MTHSPHPQSAAYAAHHAVVTGGPGIGKTTVLDLLAGQGHLVVPEAARQVIEREQALGSDILPWKDVDRFQEAVTELQLELEAAAAGRPAFLDRGIVDGHGYCCFFGGRTPEAVGRLGRRRYRRVFILDPLPPSLYRQDAARWEDEETAKGIHVAVVDAYRHFGYELVVVPVLSPEERVAHILARL